MARAVRCYPLDTEHVSAAPNSRYVGSEVVQSTTLDLLQARLTMVPPFFIKLDLQGGELAALHGATEVLRATRARVKSS